MTVRWMGTAVMAAALAAGGAGCSRTDKSGDNKPKPANETQSATATTGTNMTTTVTGCLRAGEASDTYVLTAAQAAGAKDTATYQLVGGSDSDLRGHIGERVQVSGTMTSEQQVASRTPPRAEQDRAKGTSGTPTVQTETDVQIRRLRVDSVAPQNQKCGT